MAGSETMLGVGLSILGISAPVTIAALRLLGRKNGGSKLPTDIVVDGTCSERRCADRKLLDEQMLNMQNDITGIQDKLDTHGTVLAELKTTTTLILDKVK